MKWWHYAIIACLVIAFGGNLLLDIPLYRGLIVAPFILLLGGSLLGVFGVVDEALGSNNFSFYFSLALVATLVLMMIYGSEPAFP